MPAERKSSKTQDPNLSHDGKAIVFVHLNSHKVILDCPGVLVSQVGKPLDAKKRQEFAEAARARAEKNRKWMMNNGKLNTELLKRLNIITQRRIVESADVFTFETTDTEKDFDIAGKTSF